MAADNNCFSEPTIIGAPRILFQSIRVNLEGLLYLDWSALMKTLCLHVSRFSLNLTKLFFNDYVNNYSANGCYFMDTEDKITPSAY